MLSLVFLYLVAAALQSSNVSALCQVSAGHTPTRLVTVPISAELLPQLFTERDYPAQALRNHWQGEVVADLTIDPEGHVAGCSIARSSGHEALDAKTCEVLKSRARFTPTQDSNGNPVEGRCRTTSFNWKM